LSVFNKRRRSQNGMAENCKDCSMRVKSEEIEEKSNNGKE
jgi:hypothetical protein